MRPGLFLDRDGIVNEDTHFVHRREDFVFTKGIFDVVSTARTLGYVPIIVTNQSGIARGMFDETAYRTLTDWMLEEMRRAGAPVDGIYHCPFLPDAMVEAYRHPDHPWRKPQPGMLLAAAEEHGLDLGRSAMIGDRWSDAMAGWAAGLTQLALVGDRPDREGRPEGAPPVERLPDVLSAVDWLRGRAAEFA